MATSYDRRWLTTACQASAQAAITSCWRGDQGAIRPLGNGSSGTPTCSNSVIARASWANAPAHAARARRASPSPASPYPASYTRSMIGVQGGRPSVGVDSRHDCACHPAWPGPWRRWELRPISGCCEDRLRRSGRRARPRSPRQLSTGTGHLTGLDRSRTAVAAAESRVTPNRCRPGGPGSWPPPSTGPTFPRAASTPCSRSTSTCSGLHGATLSRTRRGPRDPCAPAAVVPVQRTAPIPASAMHRRRAGVGLPDRAGHGHRDPPGRHPTGPHHGKPMLACQPVPVRAGRSASAARSRA